MGLGYALVCGSDDADSIVESICKSTPAKVIGVVEEGTGVTAPTLDLRYDKY